MGKSVTPLTQKMIAALAAFALAFSMGPVAWADDAPAGTLAGAMAGNAAEAEAPGDGADADSGADGAAASDAEAPEADL